MNKATWDENKTVTLFTMDNNTISCTAEQNIADKFFTLSKEQKECAQDVIRSNSKFLEPGRSSFANFVIDISDSKVVEIQTCQRKGKTPEKKIETRILNIEFMKYRVYGNIRISRL